VFYFSVGDEMEHGVCGFEGPPDPIDPFFQDPGDKWKCHFAGHLFVPGPFGKPRKTSFCLYDCFPEGGVGITVSLPHITTLEKACPEYYSNPEHKGGCPQTFEALEPGNFILAAQPDVIENSCEGKSN